MEEAMRSLCYSGLYIAVIVFTLTEPLSAGVLTNPNANQVEPPFFVQPFSFVTVDSVSAGMGHTSLFFSSLPTGSYPTFQVVNILGNFIAFDSLGNPVTTFNITGVSVTTGGHTLTPPSGQFNFAGHPSVTFTDALNPLNTATFFSTDLTFAFTFVSDPSLTYSYTLTTTGLDAGSTIVFDDAEATVPEPGHMYLLVGTALIIMQRSRARHKRA
jgi:hypothetical protein